MELDNYRELSGGGSGMGAGFQFEFQCSNCSNRWKSPFKPYRMGQITGLFQRFAFLFGNGMNTASRTTGGLVDYGNRGAREEALNEARQHANTLYTICEHCKHAVCEDCKGRDEATCHECNEKIAAQNATNAMMAGSQGAGAMACSNCGAGHSGGRFCAECGFDMASTHKSCPGCGTMTSRQSRFCTDCGHSF